MEIPDFDVFMSHNIKDQAAVLELGERLRENGVVPWIAQNDIAVGVMWESVLDQALDRGSGSAIFIGPHGFGKWQQVEYYAAVHRHREDESFRVVPVLLPGSDDQVAQLPAMLRIFDRIDFRAGLNDERAFRAFVNTFHGAVSPIPPPQRGGSVADGLAPGPRRQNMSGATAIVAAPVSRLSDNKHVLQQYIKDLIFTPVIGYGCSLIGRSHGVAWRRIAEEMRTLLCYLPPEDPAADYVRQLAGTPVYEVPLRKQLPDRGEDMPENPLLRLQLALADVGAKLNRIFAMAMLEFLIPVWDTPSYRLPISADNPLLPDVGRALICASVAAFDLKEPHEARDPAVGLEAHGLYDRLVGLTADLTPGHHVDSDAALDHLLGDGARSLERVLSDIEDKLRNNVRENASAGEVGLALYHLEWIADALWHTFRYDKPAYPRADELAFQISLLASSVRDRRPELASAAEVGRTMLEASTVAAWFRRYSEYPPTSLHEFYDAIARILKAEYQAYHVYQRAVRRKDVDPDELKVMQSVAFSANYDLEMEAALQRVANDKPFHVVIPVNAYRRRGADPEFHWLLGTHYGGPVERISQWEWFPRNRSLQPDEIKGPILIKLHGSPMHQLPEDVPESDAMPVYTRLEHALVLSEREYLDNIVWKDPLPDFFSDILLQKERALFFLGQSLNQWGTRLRIYSHVLRRENPPSTGQRIAIGRSSNPYRSAVLGTIGIQRWIGELEEIPDIVDSVLD